MLRSAAILAPLALLGCSGIDERDAPERGRSRAALEETREPLADRETAVPPGARAGRSREAVPEAAPRREKSPPRLPVSKPRSEDANLAAAGGSSEDSGDGEDVSAPERPPARRAPPAAEAKRPPARPAQAMAPRAALEAAAGIVRDLKDPRKAQAAFWHIAEVPKPVIPYLVEEVENPALSGVERVRILVVEPDFVGEGKDFLANRIHGLGQMEIVEEIAPGDFRVTSRAYTKHAYGIAPNKKYMLELEKFGGFPVGVVVRAGLVNRFKSTRYPRSTDDDPTPGKLIEWWKQFYREAGPGLAGP
jgi:hypothetical protein